MYPRLTPAALLLSFLVVLFPLQLSAALEPFAMPWNDASAGPTNLSSWQAPIPVSAARLTIDASAHYQLNDQRVRLLGVNIGADAAFPSHAAADAHAARLARFGFNAVRFHHMEAPWAPNSVLLDYASGNSRTLSADRLDRLHYFVARLADQGVFSNINLLVSREFKAADGLGSEITQLGWKDQHILGFFVPAALALHKEHATKLLGASNPHRSGKSLAQDPAVAVVEIMNENGLLQKWYEGVLDALPSVYGIALREKWNLWLQAKYSGSPAMLQAWGAVDAPFGSEKLTNSNFSSALTAWSLEQHQGAAATASSTTDFNGQSSARIAVTSLPSQGWHLQFNQSNLPLLAGQVYTLSFWARSSLTTASASAVISRAHTDYASLSPSLSLSLGNTWKQYTLTFQSAVNETNARLSFSDFGSSLSTLWLADVSLKPGGTLGALPSGVSLEARNVPTTLRKPSGNTPSIGQQRDWIDFCLGLERSYWDTMYSHIKYTLGFQGIVWGSIISNSPPNAQAGLDAMDSHAYWQHPQFDAGYDWDPVRWKLENISMVNSPASNTLTGIARQRVKGYPHNVTEYQHPSPNSYSAEGPLLSAAIGALQDWDSLWMFDYGTGNAEFVTGFFDQSGHPGKMVNNLVAASLFRRGDLGPSRREYVVAQSPSIETQSALTTGGAWSIADGSHLGVPGALANLSRLSLSIGSSAKGLSALPAAPSGPIYTSDNGQLKWDMSVVGKGVFTVDTPRTKVFVGFAEGRSFDLSGIKLSPGASRLGWCTLAVMLTEGDRFEALGPRRLLIVATGDQENTGQVWKDATRTSVGSNWGRAPVLVEALQATVRLPFAAKNISAWALDSKGQRAAALTVLDDAGGALLKLGQSGTTLWYEVLIGAAGSAAPVILQEPRGSSVEPGARVELSCSADGFPAPTCTWWKNGEPLSSTSTSSLVFPLFSADDAGEYWAVYTNSAGTALSRKVRLQLNSARKGDTGKLVNVSTRADVGVGYSRMVMGFYVEGQREILVRAVGPKLATDFGVTGALPDPMMELDPVDGSKTLDSNDNWDASDVSLTQAFALTGAFPLQGSPLESCLLRALPAGGFTATVHGAKEQLGNCLVEAYDTGKGSEGRLLNLSTRAVCGSATSSVALGFSVSGKASRRFLIRGIGPGLLPYGITTVVADPIITLYDVGGAHARKLYENDDWEDYGAGPIASAAMASTGAFSLGSLSRDAAMVVTLEPGLYSAIISSKSTKAIALVEVYELP